MAAGGTCPRTTCESGDLDVLLRELINIPTQVHDGDFVLKLTDGVDHPEETLREYVVTGQLAVAFDSALGLIRSALTDKASKAAYLHGSFGSGKSHFMAVLTLLLEGYAPIRSRSDLAPIVQKNDVWMSGRRFLVVPYHLIAAKSMEQAILGGYARYVSKHHPGAPAPAVYSSRPVFENAKGLRTTLGDEAFFSQLNAGATDDGGWGDLGSGWDPARFDAACEAAPGTDEHDALLSVLLATLLTAFKGVVSESGFVSLDEGLSAMSRHAQALGYDAVILFLDELILWLASHIANQEFITTEGQKVVKLVEAQVAERPIPIVSFVARQRDLRELVGEHTPGAEQLGFADVLRYWEGRFNIITLEDRNLPEIAERRVLAPVSDDAKRQIDEAFEKTASVRNEVWQTLLTSDADRALFRRTYPFSPAFMKALIGVSSALQRERTALKVMLHLLVDERDELQLGDLVPVGDLFDVIAQGDEPLTEGMRAQFDAARRLYANKLRPMMLAAHGLEEDDAAGLPSKHGFRTDDRLIKTLLLAALVPEVESLKNLTAGRLAALNHGTITSPIPGEERTIVLDKARRWQSEAAEIKVSDDPTDPTISIQLSGVDIESIVDAALNVDTDGERRRRVRSMVLDALGIAKADGMFLEYATTWRGTSRSVDLVFGNIRSTTDVPDAALAAAPERWKLIVDFPFDEEGYTGAYDRARLEDYERSHSSTRTVCWLPAHFTRLMTRDLGRLVKLEHILASTDRFVTYASHLGAADQAVARSMLEGQRMTLRQRVQGAVEQAYGIAHAQGGVVSTDQTQDELFVSLDRGFSPRPPVAASLRDGVDALIGQMLAHQFPAHPEFDDTVRPKDIESVYAEVSRAARTEGGRIEVGDRTLRPLLRRIANPLKLGTMHENHFTLGDHWVQHIEQQSSRAIAKGEDGTLTVGRLREWLDAPRPMGLPPVLQDLTILVFADQTNRSFSDNGGPVKGQIGRLQDRYELVEQDLPTEAEWAQATARASGILGVPPLPLRNAANVRDLAARLGEQVNAHRSAVTDVKRRLEVHATELGLDEVSERRLTAAAADALLASIGRASGSDVEAVRALVSADVPTTDQALGAAIIQAAPLARALSATRWELIAALVGHSDTRAQPALDALYAAARSDEFVSPLASMLLATEKTAVEIIAVPPPPPPPPPPGRKTRHHLTFEGAVRLLDELRSELDGRADADIEISWTEPRSE